MRAVMLLERLDVDVAPVVPLGDEERAAVEAAAERQGDFMERDVTIAWR